MSHHHHHDHHHQEVGNIRVAFFLNLAFTVIEIVGGIWANSLAILSDALHDLGDSLSLGLSWYFQKLSAKGRDEQFSYGYKRFSILGAVVNSIVLLVGSFFILNEALPQLFSPQDTNAQGMFYLSLLGIAVNGAAVLRLRKGHSINARVVSLHLLEDVLGWVAVLAGSLVMMFFDAPFIDPLLSVLISLFILFNVFKNLRSSFRIILQGIPHGLNVDDVEEILRSIPEVHDIHDCHSWSMDGQYNVLTVHLVLKQDHTLEELADIKKQVRKSLGELSINHITIEFESKEEHCELIDC